MRLIMTLESKDIGTMLQEYFDKRGWVVEDMESCLENFTEVYPGGLEVEVNVPKTERPPVQEYVQQPVVHASPAPHRDQFPHLPQTGTEPARIMRDPVVAPDPIFEPRPGIDVVSGDAPVQTTTSPPMLDESEENPRMSMTDLTAPDMKAVLAQNERLKNR